MTRIGRVVRGVLGSAVVWAMVLPLLQVGLTAVGSIFGVPVPPRQFWAAMLVRAMIGGALNGVVFGGILALVGRRRTLATIGTARVALAGALAGSVYPLASFARYLLHVRAYPNIPRGDFPVVGFAITVIVGGAIGAVWASAALRIGRRSERSSAINDKESFPMEIVSDESESLALPAPRADHLSVHSSTTPVPVQR